MVTIFSSVHIRVFQRTIKELEEFRIGSYRRYNLGNRSSKYFRKGAVGSPRSCIGILELS